MTVPGQRFTYADYCLLPEDKRYELIEGDLLMTPAPNVPHQKISFVLTLRLGNFVEGNILGQVLAAPTDVILSEENVVQPDLLFVAAERLGILSNRGIEGAPDLVVEILSPSGAARDQVLKRKLYSKYGVREYWIVDPEGHTVEVLTRAEVGLQTWQVFAAGDALRSPLLPGLSLQVDDLFRS